MLRQLHADLHAARDPAKAAFFPRFFRTGKGEYGEGDVFLGVTVPRMRAVAKAHRDLGLQDIERLLADPIHERRLTGLFILVSRYERGDDATKKETVAFYLDHLAGVNNWDLVDATAYKILGDWLLRTNNDAQMDQMTASANLWERRIAIVATLAFIRAGRLEPTFRMSTRLISDKYDLLHKAVGWMLREAGKRDASALRRYLDTHAARLPRTALRYALERLPNKDRRHYMALR